MMLNIPKSPAEKSFAGGKILQSLSDGIGIITFNNPGKRNAMSLDMWEGLGQSLVELRDDPDVRVVILTGAGDKAFVSGADISEFASQRAGHDAVNAYDDAVARAQSSLIACGKPVVASMRGVCFGGGIGLALACDLRYAAADTRFRMPAGRLGLGYRLGGMRQIVHSLGAPRTAELFFTARIFDGIEAERIGMVHQSVAADALDRHVQEVVSAIAENAPLTLRAAKLAIRAALEEAAGADTAHVDRAVLACFDSADYLEGQAAFAEKRAPRFQGR
jgi:enoyl-CoA hydratase/carnithine racemase